MKQLMLPIQPPAAPKERKRKPCCPYCKTPLKFRGILLVWNEFKDWLVRNKGKVSLEVLRAELREPPLGVNLQTDPDLQWAIRATARDYEMSEDELVRCILDSFFYGEFELRFRRGKKTGITIPD